MTGFDRKFLRVLRWVSAFAMALWVCSSAQAQTCRSSDAASSARSVREESVRVIVRTTEQVSVSAELNARITKMPRREGDRFQSGDVLVSFDCRRLEAEREASAASFNSARSSHQSLLALRRYDAAGSLDVEKSQFDMEKAQAELRAMDARLTTCVVHAPFPGRVVEKSAHLNEIAQPNQPLLKLINEDKLEIVLMVPSSIVAKVKNGQRFNACIDETREAHDAVVVQSTGLIDPVSQTVRVIGEFVARPRGVLPGMSGAASLQLED